MAWCKPAKPAERPDHMRMIRIASFEGRRDDRQFANCDQTEGAVELRKLRISLCRKTDIVAKEPVQMPGRAGHAFRHGFDGQAPT